MTCVKRGRRPEQRRHRRDQYAQGTAKANQNPSPQNELFVPYPDQEHTGKPQDNTMQPASRTQKSATQKSETSRIHHTRTTSNRPGSNTQAQKSGHPQKGSHPYHRNTERHSLKTSNRCANYGSAGVPMDIAVEGNHSGRRGVASQLENNQEHAANYTEQSGFPQENRDSYYEQRTNCPPDRWNERPDDRQDVASWVDAAVTTMDDGLEDEIMFRKMQQRVAHMIDELQEMWQALKRRSPYHKAKEVVHQMMEENSDDHEGMRIVSRKLDDAAREFGGV